MSNQPGKQSAYGTASDDTSFRKTYNKEDYLAKSQSAESKEQARQRYEAKLAGKKWHAPVDTSALDNTTSRASRLDVSSMVGKTTLVPAGSAVGKRGRGAGFYCPDCDLTFKDNVQLVEHLNSKQHLIATGQNDSVAVASVEDVMERLDMLVARKRQKEEEARREGNGVNLAERLRIREEVDEVEREERRKKRQEKRRLAREAREKEDEGFGDRLGIIA